MGKVQPDFEIGPLSKWERTTGHRQEQCSSDGIDCGGSCICCTLSLCRICGGLEGALLPTCPGHRLTMEEHDANYADYCHGTGPFATEIRQ